MIVTVIEIKHSLKKCDTWKIQLTIANKFFFSIDNDEERAIYSKSDNIETMINDEADEVIREIFRSLKNRYQKNWKSMKGCHFAFDYVHLLHYKCHEINPNHTGWYIDSPDWIKNKKVTLNPIDKKRKQMLSIRSNNHVKSWKNRKNPERITKIKAFINKYKWERVNFQSEKDNWKEFEKNNTTTSLNFLYAKKEKITRAYVSKHNLNCKKQVIFLKIPNDKEINYLAVKKLSALLRGITSKHHRYFYCKDYHYSFAIKNKLKSYECLCENKDFCNISMQSEDNKIL